MNTDHHVVVLGAGYTGMLCALRLARRTRRTGVRITLVNPSARFTERLRMHQVAAGQQLTEHRIPDLLAGTGITFRRHAAVAVDPVARRITLDGDGQTLGYDTLVYALGSSTDTSRVPGADTHAFTLDAPGRLAARLGELAPTGGIVTICGGGLTGIEAAAEIAESHPTLNVTLIGLGEPGSGMGAKARTYLHRALDRLGVIRVTGARVAKVLPDAVELADGTLVASDACLWTTGVRVSSLAADAGIATDDRGLILVDAGLRSISHPEIHAIGDAAAVRQAWGPIHGTCQSGLPTAAYTADAIAGRLRGKTVRPFRFGYFHQPVSLGRRDAVIQFTRADDTPRRAVLTGRLAVAYKEFVSGSPLKVYRLGKRVSVSVSLSKGGRATRKPIDPRSRPRNRT